MSALSVAVVTSHPIQYYSPIFRELSRLARVHVFFAHRPTPEQQAGAGYGVPFEWDIDLTSGFDHTFLENISAQPSTETFRGCDTPSVAAHLKEGYDVLLVTGWNLKAYWQAIFSARRVGLPVMVRGDSQLRGARGVIKTATKKILYPSMLKIFDAFLYPGARNRSYLEHYKVPEAKLYFSPHCIDVDFFSTRSTIDARKAVRTELGISDDETVLTFVGRLLSLKRPTDLIEAAASLQQSGVKLSVAIAGAGDLHAQVVQKAKDLDVRLFMMGFCNQSRMPAIYAAGDVLVLPSEHETWGLVVNEAIASGCPAVVSDACGCSADLAGLGQGVYSFPVGDVRALSTAIRLALCNGSNKSSLSQLSANYSPAAAALGIMRAADAVVARKRGLAA